MDRFGSRAHLPDVRQMNEQLDAAIAVADAAGHWSLRRRGFALIGETPEAFDALIATINANLPPWSRELREALQPECGVSAYLEIAAANPHSESAVGKLRHYMSQLRANAAAAVAANAPTPPTGAPKPAAPVSANLSPRAARKAARIAAARAAGKK